MPEAVSAPVILTESSAHLTESTTPASSPTHRRYRARILEADVWGSSGFYGRDVLEEAVNRDVFADQVPIYIDHPTESDRIERPGRSVRDLAGKLVGGSVMEADGIYSDIEVYGHVAPLIEAVKDDIGMSIRAGGLLEQGEVNGKTGPIVQEITEAVSVDFVTAAGAGGRIMSLLEGAAVNKRAIAHGIEEATVNDRREALSTLLKDEHGGDKIYVWLRDFDDSTAWFEVEGSDDAGVFAQTYTSTDGIPSGLDGDRTEVRVSTTYVPVTPAGQSTTTQESEEDTMPQIEEGAVARQLEEANGRVTELETELTETRTERDTARRELAEATARTAADTRARTRVRESNSELAGAVVDRIVAESLREVPLTEEQQLDEAAFDRRVDEARTAEESYLASLNEAAGAGRVTAFGTTKGKGNESELREDNDKQRAGIFGRTIKEA